MALILEIEDNDVYFGFQEEILALFHCREPLFREFAKVVVYQKVSTISIVENGASTSFQC
jgi:hypothetical protein